MEYNGEGIERPVLSYDYTCFVEGTPFETEF